MIMIAHELCIDSIDEMINLDLSQLSSNYEIIIDVNKITITIKLDNHDAVYYKVMLPGMSELLKNTKQVIYWDITFYSEVTDQEYYYQYCRLMDSECKFTDRRELSEWKLTFERDSR